MHGLIILTSQDEMKMITLARLHYVGAFDCDCVKSFEKYRRSYESFRKELPTINEKGVSVDLSDIVFALQRAKRKILC